MVVVTGENGMIELINPTITKMSEATQNVREGSIAPGASGGTVTRPKSVTVSAFDRNGNPITVCGNGFLAATFCHELVLIGEKRAIAYAVGNNVSGNRYTSLGEHLRGVLAPEG